jgi:hypothetical protein
MHTGDLSDLARTLADHVSGSALAGNRPIGGVFIISSHLCACAHKAIKFAGPLNQPQACFSRRPKNDFMALIFAIGF